jgi:hypothetical protein
MGGPFCIRHGHEVLIRVMPAKSSLLCRIAICRTQRQYFLSLSPNFLVFEMKFSYPAFKSHARRPAGIPARESLRRAYMT